MSTVHDARLVPVACVAWAAALAATGESTLGLSGLLMLAAWLGAGLAVACGAIVVGRRRDCPLASVAVLALAAAVAVLLVADAQRTRDESQAAALTAAGVTETWITVSGQSAPMSGWGGQPRHRVPATVKAWRPQCREPPACVEWTATNLPVMVSLETAPRRGESLLTAATWERSDRAPTMAVAWDADTVHAAPPSVLVQWRARFETATEGLSDDARGLVRGMVVGDTSAMPPSQVQDMRVAGLAHLTAVSGAHFAILIMATGALLAAGGMPRGVRAIAILVVASTFAVLVGPEASVLRALGMAVAVALALVWGRPARGLAALTTSVIVLLVVEPALSRSLGFAMSVLAVGAIVLWAPRVAALLAKVVTPALARIAAIPIAAQTAVTPVLVVIDPHIGAYAVIANLAAGVAVLPAMLAGAVTLACAAVSVPVAQLTAGIAGICAGAISTVARTAASAPGSWVQWPAGVWGVAAAIAVALLMVCATARLSSRSRSLVIAAATAVVLIASIGVRDQSGPVMEGWDVALCDVGQGDMMLVRAGQGAAIVIDTGPPDGGAAQCLRRHGIERVPLLILTHPHQDHDGAVVAVLATAEVDEAWVSGAGADGPAAHVLAGAGVSVEVPEPGSVHRAGAAEVTVLSQAHARPDVEGNDASVVVHTTAGATTALALGDLEEGGQRALAGLLPAGITVDVVKVAHHGSADQSPELIARIDAAVAMISAGRDNRHGHPTDSALELYGATAATVLRTDLCGDLHIGTVDGVLTWSPCPTGMAR